MILCIYTTKLERILTEISDFDEPAAVPPSGGLPRRKFRFAFLFCARLQKNFSIKEKRNFLLGSALRAGSGVLISTRTRREEGCGEESRRVLA